MVCIEVFQVSLGERNSNIFGFAFFGALYSSLKAKNEYYFKHFFVRIDCRVIFIEEILRKEETI